ncbi:MAG: hypothetical protein IKI67_00600 [Bacteroidales bacterium]|nr:hypothetical protein [Bacteroidales bacterium]
MKKIKDIEKISDLELEKIALDDDLCTPPDGLQSKLEQFIDTQVAESRNNYRMQRIRWISVAAAAIVVAAILLPKTFKSKELKDTFNDPHLAYAELKKTFNLISEKISDVSEKAIEAEQIMTKPIEIINKPITLNNNED